MLLYISNFEEKQKKKKNIQICSVREELKRIKALRVLMGRMPSGIYVEIKKKRKKQCINSTQ